MPLFCVEWHIPYFCMTYSTYSNCVMEFFDEVPCDRQVHVQLVTKV